MNIYINARFLTQPITGVQRYAVELVKRWDRMLAEGQAAGRREEKPAGRQAEKTGNGSQERDSSKERESSRERDSFRDSGNVRDRENVRDHRYTLLAPPDILYEPELKHIRLEKVGKLRGHAWEQFALPYYARDGLLVNLCNTGPLAKRNQIATIHDTAVFEYPDSFTFSFRSAYKVIQGGLGRRAKTILTVSQFSKSQIMRHCGANERKIKVVPLGKEHIGEVRSDPGVYAKHGLTPKNYILAVSSRNPYKNFAGLLSAMERLGDRNYEIAIAGASNSKVFGRAELSDSERVKWLGYVSDEELKALFEGAACFVFPSFYEGFGLPPLEAMACGTPILASRAASIPEVCGEACLYFDPHDPDDIARQIGRVMDDPELRTTLRDKGYRRADAFSWDACARETLQLIQEGVR